MTIHSERYYQKAGKINLKGLTLFELEELFTQWGEPKYRAKQLMSWMYRKRGGDIRGNDEPAPYAKAEVGGASLHQWGTGPHAHRFQR